jgi:hypothetical protein
MNDLGLGDLVVERLSDGGAAIADLLGNCQLARQGQPLKRVPPLE